MYVTLVSTSAWVPSKSFSFLDFGVPCMTMLEHTDMLSAVAILPCGDYQLTDKDTETYYELRMLGISLGLFLTRSYNLN